MNDLGASHFDNLVAAEVRNRDLEHQLAEANAELEHALAGGKKLFADLEAANAALAEAQADLEWLTKYWPTATANLVGARKARIDRAQMAEAALAEAMQVTDKLAEALNDPGFVDTEAVKLINAWYKGELRARIEALKARWRSE